MNWLLTEGRECPNIPDLLSKLGPILQAETGCSRFWLGTTVLHPQAAAYIWSWEAGKVIERSLSYVHFARLEANDSPALRLRLGEEEIYLQAPNDDGMPDVQVLFKRGYVDFFAHSIFFRKKWIGGFSYSSTQGFEPSHLELFRTLNPVMSAVVEPLTNDLVTAKLLETYLGRDAGRKVFLGQVKRGDGQILRSVIWFCDIRGFTSMCERLDLDSLLQTLNQAFEEIVHAIESQGGQVLKFIGDAVLAIFPCDQDDEQACRAAQKAAAHLIETMEVVQIGIGLHLGDVNYGNIGSPGRLDFTVIGPDVNLSARVEGQTSKLGKSILATSEIASYGDWEQVGNISLKGVAEPVLLYSPLD